MLSYRQIAITISVISTIHLIFFIFLFSSTSYRSSFTIIFLLSGDFLLSATLLSRTYSGCTLGGFLWLGLWGKFIGQAVNRAVLIEPTGTFDFSLAAYDQTMMVSAVGGAAAGVVILLFSGCPSALSFDRGKNSARGGVANNTQWRYVVVLLLVAAVALANTLLGIFQIGLVPRTILPWPGNAMIALFLSTGYVPLFALLIQKDLFAGRSMIAGYLAFAVAATMVAISLMSRGLIVFHSLALLLFILATTQWWADVRRRIELGAALAFLLLAFVTSLYFVEANRRLSYAVDASTLPTGPGLFSSIARLAVSRWVGLEGVMVAVGEPNKSLALLEQLLGERATGVASVYQYIAHSQYIYADPTRFQFSSLPGPTGFFYLGNSLGFVALGVGLLTTICLLAELATRKLSGNQLLTSFVGVSLASLASQFGVTPLGQIPQLLYLSLAVVGVSWLGGLGKDNNS